jgi:hypothetical protein
LQFKDLHYEMIERSIPKAMRDSILASSPAHVITITEAEGGEVRVPLWRKPAYSGQKDVEFNLMKEDIDRFYAVLDDSLFVTVQRHLFDRVTPPLDQLLKR